MKKRMLFVTLIACLILLPLSVQSQPDKFFERFLGPIFRPGDLKVLQLEMNPDPVREGQWVSFQAIVSNASRHSGRVSLFIKDRDEVVASAYDVVLRPGENRVIFPQTDYRFQRFENCFTVEIDIERTRRGVELAQEFCARRTMRGWSMLAPRIGPLFVEDLDMVPDPAQPGQEIRFKARIRNDGNPLRGHLKIQDRDQVVAELRDVLIFPGSRDYWFLYSRYQFQRFDHCFTVVVDVERTPYRIDAVREFCARPYGWSLRP